MNKISNNIKWNDLCQSARNAFEKLGVKRFEYNGEPRYIKDGIVYAPLLFNRLKEQGEYHYTFEGILDLPDEVWRVIEGYEDYYVSNYGRVAHVYFTRKGKLTDKKPQLLRPLRNEKGYLYVNFCDKIGKLRTGRINRLVAKAFHENPDPEFLTEAGHANDRKLDNRADNIYWTDHKSNCNYGGRNDKLRKSRGTPCECEGRRFDSQKELAEYYNVDRRHIDCMLNGTQPMPKKWQERGLKRI